MRELHTAGLLARHVASLGETYRALSRATGLKDLARRFCGHVQEYSGAHDIRLWHRAGDQKWQSLLQEEAGSTPLFPAIRETETFAATFDAEGVRLLAAQNLADGSTLGIVLGLQQGNGTFPDDAIVSLHLSANLFDNVYRAHLHRQHEKELAFSLNQRLLQLNSLIDTGIEIAALDSANSPCRLALERAVALTNASQGTVTVLRGDQVIERIAFPGEPSAEEGSAENSCITAEVTYDQLRYVFLLRDKESRSGITAFDGTDRLLLDALSRQVHASLENRYLLRQSLEKQKMEQDIAVAASIQQRILPSVLPVIDGYDAAGINIPSKSVGGDYYDCVQLQDGRYALVVADVAGKGIPAALLVSSFQAFLTAYLESDMPLVTMAARLNSVIHRASTDDKFITAFIGLLEPQTGVLDYVNAGHNIVYCRRTDRTIVELSEGGIPFGMLDLNLPYASGRITLERGDRLLLYTDGIPEAHNPAQELYETHSPLQEFFARVVPEKAEEFIRDLIADVKQFTADAPQADDITALYLIRT